VNTNISYGHQSENRLDEIKKLLKEHYVFQKNEIYDRLEYKKQDEQEFHPVNSYFKNTLLIDYLSRNRLYCSRKTLDMLLNSDFSESYNPLKDFIEHLPEWDNVDYIQQLAATLDTNDNDLFLEVLRKWLVTLSGSLISEDAVINLIFPILTGGQSIEKALWIRNLVPQGLLPFYFEGTIYPSTMDDRKKFAENAIVYLIELQPVTKQRKFEELKLFIASKEKIRRTHGRSAASRRASVIGTTEQHLNNDILGYKIVICFEVKAVDYKHQVPMEMVFAQALHLYRNDFPYWFSVEEMTRMNKDQEQEKIISIQELVSMYIEPSPSEAEDTVTGMATNIAKLLFEESGIERKVTQSDAVKLGQYLSSNGFEHFTGHAGTKKYYYKLKYPEN
jgi:predicted P-loop ATPase